MRKYIYSIIGTFHTNHNEDFLVLEEIGETQFLIAVMDGCTMGKESHFAATLIGKILRRIAKEKYYKAFITKEKHALATPLKGILEALFLQLKILKNDLVLEKEELLSTLMLGIVDKKTKCAELLTVGDGVVHWDGNLLEYDQANKPDYLGYHLDEDFESWYASQTQRLSLTNLQDLSIASDGIFTFQKLDTKSYEKISEAGWIHFLLYDIEGNEKEQMLKRKVMELEEDYGLKATDDLTIIRLLF